MDVLTEIKPTNSIKSSRTTFEPVVNKYISDTCPLCSGNHCLVIYSEPLIAWCADCGHAFKQKQDSDVISGYTGKVKMPENLVARYYNDLIEEHIGFGNINSLLEIGSGDGILIDLIRKRNSQLEITVIEPSEHHCRHLREIPNITVINDYVEKAPSGRGYDLIILSHVLEHLPNPRGTLQVIFQRFLNPGGMFS